MLFVIVVVSVVAGAYCILSVRALQASRTPWATLRHLAAGAIAAGVLINLPEACYDTGNTEAAPPYVLRPHIVNATFVTLTLCSGLLLAVLWERRRFPDPDTGVGGVNDFKGLTVDDTDRILQQRILLQQYEDLFALTRHGRWGRGLLRELKIRFAPNVIERVLEDMLRNDGFSVAVIQKQLVGLQKSAREARYTLLQVRMRPDASPFMKPDGTVTQNLLPPLDPEIAPLLEACTALQAVLELTPHLGDVRRVPGRLLLALDERDGQVRRVWGWLGRAPRAWT